MGHSLAQRPRTLRPTPRLQDQFVSAYATPSGMRLLLLHDGRSDDAIKAFFTDAHELLVKVGSCTRRNGGTPAGRRTPPLPPAFRR